MTSYAILALLAALVGAVVWLALETRRVHLALRVYAAAVQQWQETLQQFRTSQGEERR